jgi:hypothetical protein
MGDLEQLFWMIPFAVPILAIVGGITIAIVKILGQQRLAELERRERIAAIERGIDPAKLPPITSIADFESGGGSSRTRRAHGLMIGGLICVAIGISLMIGLRALEPNESHWVLGTMPLLVGVALLVSAVVIWPRGGGRTEGK